ncbi:MAG: hypothetical protein KF832_17625 [Caldilineaceae bacterium]|nr:hypothetical protein [Caldilineaceae bacterium]
MSTTAWLPIEPDLSTALAAYSNPIQALAEAQTPAVVLREAYSPAECKALVKRFVQWGLMRDAHDANSADKRTRIDIGTSLGNRGSDQDAFLDHAVSTHELFPHLFSGFTDPVKTMYDALAALAPGKEVKTAREPDGRLYGPAIFRIHYTTHSYIPHIDSVRLREKRTNYAVYRFEHQFAGILCLQNALHGERSAQTIVHNCLWNEEIQPQMANGTFHDYAAENQIQNYRVDLAPGDLYFFNTRCIHEIPPLDGNNPRIVLAVFIGYSPDDPEVYVWA